jgi:hypothetical protein
MTYWKHSNLGTDVVRFFSTTDCVGFLDYTAL